MLPGLERRAVCVGVSKTAGGRYGAFQVQTRCCWSSTCWCLVKLRTLPERHVAMSCGDYCCVTCHFFIVVLALV